MVPLLGNILHSGSSYSSREGWGLRNFHDDLLLFDETATIGILFLSSRLSSVVLMASHFFGPMFVVDYPAFTYWPMLQIGDSFYQTYLALESLFICMPRLHADIKGSW